jgi:hypothetical protein
VAIAAGASARTGELAMGAIVTLSLLVVVIAANRPSLLTPTTHVGYFPHWMAGPLGGLIPGFTSNSTTLKYWFSGAIVLMYVCYVVALRAAPRLPVRWVVGAILAVHAVFLLSPPLALTDLFNYVNYGRMEVVHNLNPYVTIPILEPHNDPSFMLSNWHELLSPYGPLFTIVTFIVVPLGVAGSFWALKGLLMLTSLAIVLLVWKCARLLGRDPRAAVMLVGLNPIVLVWGLGGDHNDFLMVFFMMLGFYLLLLARANTERLSSAVRAAPAEEPSPGDGSPGAHAASDGYAAQARGWGERLREWLLPLSPLEMSAGAGFVIATGIKASGGILIPVVLVALLRTPRRLTQVLLGMAISSAIVAILSVLFFGLHIPDLGTQSKLVTSESIPNLIGLLFGSGGENELLHKLMDVVLIASVIGCCWMAWSKRWPSADRLLTASGWASVALLVSLSWVLPWYVLWVLPLTALSSSRRLRGAALVIGVYLIIAWAPVSGLLWNAIGFHPESTAIGKLHQRYVKELLN